MRRRLTAGFGTLLAVLLLVGDPTHGRPAEPPRGVAQDVALRAGAARVTLRLPTGTPLGGYGSARRRLLLPDVLGLYPHAFWFKPSEGALDEIAARALVLYAGSIRVTWIAVDLVAVDQRLMRHLAERFAKNGIRPGTVILSASHTHSGPGAYLSSSLFAFTALDREDAAVRDVVLEAIVDAARRAGAAARDARVAAATVTVPALTTSRLRKPVDRSLVVLKFTTTTGEPIAAVWNYAIHGTMLGPKNLMFSGDVMGVASRTLESRLNVPALFVNGAVGDVSPRHHGAAAMASDGRALAENVEAAWRAATPTGTAPLVVRTARVDLPPPTVSLRHCVARWLPAGVRMPIGGFLPTQTEMVAVALGRIAWVTMPGEPVSALGADVRDSAHDRWAHVVVAGLSNDYLGYFVRPEDYDDVDYVTCAAVYGPRVGRCVASTATELLRRLPQPGASSEAAPGCSFTGR